MRTTPAKHFLPILFFALLTSFVVGPAKTNAQPALAIDDMKGLADASSPVAPDEILKRFVQAETRFRETLIDYSFKRDVVLQTIGPNGEITGEYVRNSIFVLNARGERIEKVTFHPKPTMKDLTITKEDIQDLAGSQMLGLEVNDLSAYNLAYLGRADLDGHSVHVITVGPRERPDPHQMRSRFFVGKVWVHPESFQIVKLEGITEPQGKQRFARFVTHRTLKIQDVLAPTTTFADDVLRFPNKDVHYRVSVRYYDFKRFTNRVTIIEID